MSKYKLVKVDIPIDQDSELYRRIQKLATRQGCSWEEMVAQVTQLGVIGHIERNVTSYEKVFN